MRIAICQPSVPHYRGPTFNILGSMPGIQLTLFADPGGVAAWAAAKPEHFTLITEPIRRNKLLPSLRYQPAMLEVMDPGRFDLVILPWDVHFTSLMPAVRKARKRGVPVVLWGHGYSKRDRPLRTWARLRVARRADGLLLYTRTIADRLTQQYGFPSNHIFVAQNALDQRPMQEATAHWCGQLDQLTQFRRQHHLDLTQTIIFVSRLSDENRCDLLIDALAMLRKERPDAQLVIVGKGPDQQRLEQHARSTGQSDHVIFTGAIYDEMKLAPWMLSATLFCYPVNIGLSILHAFGYGLPVVTSDNVAGHNPEIESLIPDANGLLYRDGDVGNMVAQWKQIMDDPNLRQRMSEQALKTVTERYTIDNMVKGFVDTVEFARKLKKQDAGADA